MDPKKSFQSESHSTWLVSSTETLVSKTKWIVKEHAEFENQKKTKLLAFSAFSGPWKFGCEYHSLLVIDLSTNSFFVSRYIPIRTTMENFKTATTDIFELEYMENEAKIA